MVLGFGKFGGPQTYLHWLLISIIVNLLLKGNHKNWARCGIDNMFGNCTGDKVFDIISTVGAHHDMIHPVSDGYFQYGFRW